MRYMFERRVGMAEEIKSSSIPTPKSGPSYSSQAPDAAPADETLDDYLSRSQQEEGAATPAAEPQPQDEYDDAGYPISQRNPRTPDTRDTGRGKSKKEGKESKESAKESAAKKELEHISGPLQTEKTQASKPVADKFSQRILPDDQLQSLEQNKDYAGIGEVLGGGYSPSELADPEFRSGIFRGEFHERNADEWGLRTDTEKKKIKDPQTGKDVESPIPSTKGTPMEGTLSYDYEKGEFSFLPDDKRKERHPFKDNPSFVTKDLLDHDVLGYARKAFNWDSINEQQQTLLFQHIISKGASPLERLNYVEKKRVESMMNRRSSEDDPYGMRSRSSVPVFGDEGAHFDPTNSNNREDLLRYNLGSFSTSRKEDYDKAIEAFEDPKSKLPNDKKDRVSQMTDLGEVMKELGLDKSAETPEEQMASEKKRVFPETRQAFETAQGAVKKDGEKLVEEVQASEAMQRQLALQAQATAKQEEIDNFKMQEKIFETAKIYPEDLSVTNPDVDYDPAADLAALKSAIASQGVDVEGSYFKSSWDAYVKAVGGGETSAAWSDVVRRIPRDKVEALENDHVKKITQHLAQKNSDPEAENRTKKAELAKKMEEAGIEQNTVEAFRQGQLKTDALDGYLSAAKEKQENIHKEVEELQKQADELDQKTHLKKLWSDHKRKAKAYNDMLETHSNGQFGKANAKWREVTGEKGSPFGWDKLASKDDVEHYKEKQKSIRESRQATSRDGITFADEIAKTPGKFLDAAKTVIGSVKEGVGFINDLGEALNLKLSSQEKTRLYAQLDKVLAALDPEKRAFKRADVLGKEGILKRLEFKKPEEGTAGAALAKKAIGERKDKPYAARKADLAERLQKIGQGAGGASQLVEAEGKDKTRGKRGNKHVVTPGDFKKDWENLA